MEEVRRRFFRPMKRLSHDLAARLTQIDYDREMALVLTGTAPSGAAELYGEVCIMADANQAQAEFAILLHRDMTGKGLGPLLLRRSIDYPRKRGIGEIYGEVLSDNHTMLKLCQAFGFSLTAVPHDPGVIRATLRLFRQSEALIPQGLHVQRGREALPRCFCTYFAVYLLHHVCQTIGAASRHRRAMHAQNLFLHSRPGGFFRALYRGLVLCR
jgi:RimJ/RimL family protein N-acetyltransferase